MIDAGGHAYLSYPYPDNVLPTASPPAEVKFQLEDQKDL
jgi:hypothetical protein